MIVDKVCRICNNQNGNRIYLVKERRLNRGEKFRYLFCSRCGTLQLLDEIENVGVYYDSTYSRPIKKEEKDVNRFVIKSILRIPYSQFVYSLIQKCNIYSTYNALSGTHLNLNSEILDVGCGNGQWLYNLGQVGFYNLTGVDLFCETPMIIRNWKFVSGDIFEKSLQKYDLISFHHSFEHMDHPEDVLKRTREILKTNGICIIRIPVMGSEAWDLYKENWYQIDAPRHFFLYSIRAMQFLVRKCGFVIERIRFDSEVSQFSYSKLYKNTNSNFYQVAKRAGTKSDKRLNKMTWIANQQHKGDQAVFYLRLNKKDDRAYD